MIRPVQRPEWSPERAASDIARRIARSRQAEALSPNRVDAINHLEQYSALLAEAAEPRRPVMPLHRYMLQLELPQGGWDLVEAELSAPPEPGETIGLPRNGSWLVRERRLVRRRTNSPDHQLFVCLPAA
jgi:hypothetical protein